MSNMTYIRASFHDELSIKVETPPAHERVADRVRSEIGPSIAAIVASVVIMAGLIALRLWFLLPGGFHFAS